MTSGSEQRATIVRIVGKVVCAHWVVATQGAQLDGRVQVAINSPSDFYQSPKCSFRVRRSCIEQ